MRDDPADRTPMQTITTTEALAEFCAKAKAQPYVTVDTEFLRERTYYRLEANPKNKVIGMCLSR